MSASEREREWPDKELRAAIDEMLRLVNDAKLAAHEQGKLAARPPAGHIMEPDGTVRKVKVFVSMAGTDAQRVVYMHDPIEAADAAQRAAGGGA